MLAEGLTKGGVDRLLLHNVSNDCKYQAIHDALVHEKHLVGSATKPPPKEEPTEKSA